MKLLKSTAIIGSMTLLSRILGLVRDILWAKFLGASAINDALLTATKLPNLFRRMFAEGAFNAAFVPMYARRLEGEGEDVAANFAGEAMAALTMLVALIVIALQLTMPWSLNLIGGGLDKVAGPNGLVPYDLAVLYARITMPYLLLMSLAALFSGMMNTRNYFALAAFVPTLLNVVWITALLWPGAANLPAETLALYLAVLMTLSGFLQAGFLVYGLKRSNIRLPLKWPRLTPNVKRLGQLGVPGLIAAGITHINLMVSHTIATFQTGAASWLYYADRLYQLPLGMIGIAMGVALLPSLLRMFALGLPAFVLIKVLAPTFFARENTRTPMFFASISAVVNLVLGAGLFFTVGFYGLALATSVAAWGNVACLAYVQRKQGHFVMDSRLLSRLPRIAIAAALMGAALFWLGQFADPLRKGAILWDFALVTAVCALGIFIYFAIALVIRAFSLRDIKDAFRKSA